MFQIARNEMTDMQRQDKFTLLLIQRTLHKLTICCAAGKVLYFTRIQRVGLQFAGVPVGLLITSFSVGQSLRLKTEGRS